MCEDFLPFDLLGCASLDVPLVCLASMLIGHGGGSPRFVGAALIRLELGPLGGSELLSNPNRALVGCFVLFGHC